MKSGALSDFEPILLWGGEACYVTRRLFLEMSEMEMMVYSLSRDKSSFDGSKITILSIAGIFRQGER